MATITQKIYRCDACGQDVGKAKDLKKWRIETGAHGYNDNVVGVKGDLCVGCEEKFFTSAADFFGAGIWDLFRKKQDDGDL